MFAQSLIEHGALDAAASAATSAFATANAATDTAVRFVQHWFDSHDPSTTLIAGSALVLLVLVSKAFRPRSLR